MGEANEIAVQAVALVALMSIFGFSTGMLKVSGWGLLTFIHGIWLVCLTWLGWFSGDAPFRIHEFVGVNPDDPQAIRVAEWLHTAQAVSIFVSIFVLTSIPSLLHLFDRRIEDVREGRIRGKRPNLHVWIV